jgi:hypothetical protein
MANTILGLFRTQGDEDALADTKALALWLEKQPANDNLVIQEAMVHLLEDMGARQPKVTPDRVLAVLDLDRKSVPIQRRLLRQFLQSSLSEPERQRLWHASDDLARWFAYTYENLFETLPELFLSKKAKGQLPGVAARMFYYRGVQAKNGLFHYERWIPGKWKGLHAEYETTVRRGLAHVPFALAPNSPASERYTAEQEYLQILLMQCVNTGNLSAAQIQMAASWLRAWVHVLPLSPPPLEGPGFWLDLGLGDGLLSRKPHSVQRALFYLDIAPLHRKIGNGLVELTIRMQRVDAPSIQAEAAERRALLQRLEQLWRPKAKPTDRRGVRVGSDRPVRVATGLAAIAAVLQSADAQDEAAHRHARRRALPKVAAGHEPPTFGPVGAVPIEFQRQYMTGWKMHDTSESGCKLIPQPDEATEHKLGDLLGIQDEADTRWKIGIVRRLKKSAAGQTELGVEIIAQHSLLIAPKPVASGDTGYSVNGLDPSIEGKDFNALYLPPTQSAGRASQGSIMVPAPEYAERGRLFLTFENAGCTIELTTVLERTRQWVWSGFEMINRAQ